MAFIAPCNYVYSIDNSLDFTSCFNRISGGKNYFALIPDIDQKHFVSRHCCFIIQCQYAFCDIQLYICKYWIIPQQLVIDVARIKL